MSGLLYRLGRGSAAHPWRTICAWVAIAITTAATAKITCSSFWLYQVCSEAGMREVIGDW